MPPYNENLYGVLVISTASSGSTFQLSIMLSGNSLKVIIRILIFL